MVIQALLTFLGHPIRHIIMEHAIPKGIAWLPLGFSHTTCTVGSVGLLMGVKVLLFRKKIAKDVWCVVFVLTRCAIYSWNENNPFPVLKGLFSKVLSGSLTFPRCFSAFHARRNDCQSVARISRCTETRPRARNAIQEKKTVDRRLRLHLIDGSLHDDLSSCRCVAGFFFVRFAFCSLIWVIVILQHVKIYENLQLQASKWFFSSFGNQKPRSCLESGSR